MTDISSYIDAHLEETIAQLREAAGLPSVAPRGGPGPGRDATGPLPVTIKFLVEGDEEIGSPKLHEFVEQHRERLAADVCLHEGGGVNASGRPVVSLGVKGILAIQLKGRTAARDSHPSSAAAGA